MQAGLGEIQARRAAVLVVALSRPEALREYLKRTSWSFPVVCDPERKSYAAMGLMRTSWWTYLRGGVLAGYLRLIVRGWRPRKPFAGEDVHQLGGDFIIDGNRRLLFAHRSADPTDRPAVATLLRVLDQAAMN